METWVVEVETTCAEPAKEKEFNEWYDEVHLHDILEVPWLVRASRYELSSPAEGQPKFMAMYEAETEDIGQTMAAVGEHIKRITDLGRMSPLCVVAGLRMYRRITPPVERKKR